MSIFSKFYGQLYKTIENTGVLNCFIKFNLTFFIFLKMWHNSFRMNIFIKRRCILCRRWVSQSRNFRPSSPIFFILLILWQNERVGFLGKCWFHFLPYFVALLFYILVLFYDLSILIILYLNCICYIK